MLRAVPPVMTPTLALDWWSMRPSRMSAIARAAARIAERPSSGIHPRMGGAAVEAGGNRLLGRRAEDDLADRRRLVVDVAEPGLEPLLVECTRPEQPDLLLRREEQLDAGVRTSLRHDPPRRLEHHGDRRLVVGPEDRAAGVSDDAVLDDGLDRPGRQAPCRDGRRGRSAFPRRPRPGRRQRMFPIVEPTTAPAPSSSHSSPMSRSSARTRSATARSSPGGLGIAQSSRKRPRRSLSVRPRRRRRSAPSPARAPRRRSHGRAAPGASGAT